MQLSGDRPHLSGRCQPDRDRTDDTDPDSDQECEVVVAIVVVQNARQPRPCGTSSQRGQHDRAKNAAEMLALENLGDDGPHDGGDPVTEQTLGGDHDVDEPQRGMAAERDQGRKADRKPKPADGPYPFASNAIRQMTEPDLAGNSEKAHDAVRPRRDSRGEADFHQILRLMHLNRVPVVQAAEQSEREPPEPRGPHCSCQCPLDCSPGRIDHIGDGS